MTEDLQNLLDAIKPYTQATEILTKYFETLALEIKKLQDGNKLLMDVANQLAVAANLQPDDSIPLADKEETTVLGIEAERESALSALDKLIKQPGGKETATAIIRQHGYAKDATGTAKEKIQAETSESKLFELRKALNTALL